MQQKRSLWVATMIAAVAVGGWMGGRVSIARADTPPADDYLKTFSQILDLVERQYVDEVPSEDLIGGAVRGMLRTLDPHSNYLDRQSYREMREEQRGSFSGLGIVISLRGDDNLLTVISPIEGTPAQRAGIRAGDVIAEIEGAETIGMTIDDALVQLRGPKGTQVNIAIRREGYDQLIPFAITRDDIPTSSITYSYMIQPGIGYVRIKNFTQTTEKELVEKVAELRSQGMENLVLDLRWNPGGLLDQAVKVSSHFLRRDDKIVYTRGRTERANEEYNVTQPGDMQDLPVVILINRGSASASEIVAGAVQDHDRGLVVGETSWGKGLVQTVYSLSEGAALALTTARYYTPSGRLIQRDYASLEEYFSPEDDESLLEDHPGTDSTVDPEQGGLEKYFTDSGRTVYGGGGIRPDVRVEMSEMSKFVELLERRSTFFEYATRYRSDHPDAPDKGAFQVDDKLLAGFRSYLREKEFEFTDEEFAADADYIRRGLKAEIFANYFGLEARSRVLAEGDHQIQEALTLFPQARRLAAMHKNPSEL